MVERARARPPATRKNRRFVALLDLREPRAARPGEQRQHARVHRDPVRLRARARPASSRSRRSTLERGRRLRDDDAVAGAGRALAGHDLARPVGDVLARHLDEAERRDLDDVGLRAVALQLGRAAPPRPSARFFGFAMSMKSMTMIPPMSRSRSWRTTSFTASRLFFTIVSSSRCVEVFEREPTKRPGVDVDHRERLGVVEDQVAAGGQVDAPLERRARSPASTPKRSKSGVLLLVAMHALEHVRRGLLQVADDPLVACGRGRRARRSKSPANRSRTMRSGSSASW